MLLKVAQVGQGTKHKRWGISCLFHREQNFNVVYNNYQSYFERRIRMNESTGYSRLVAWEVYNFMAYTHAKCEFDERGVIVIKGYNDSGKSAMLQALNVLMFNIKANSQVGFIKDGCDYFRIIAYFDDGITILRDKYINGQSLYEVYKDDKVLFSTKQGNTLTKVSKVPDFIENYLGLLFHDGVCVNSRSCIDKQLLVQTTGSENYKLLNVILKSEELAVATEMLNNDKNHVLQDINSTDSKLTTAKELIGVGSKLTEELLSFLEASDKSYDSYALRLTSLLSCDSILSNLKGLEISPKLKNLDSSQLEVLQNIGILLDSINSLVIFPELETVSISQLDLLCSINKILDELNSIKDYPSLDIISTAQFDRVNFINNIYSNVISLNNSISNIDERLKELDSQMEDCVAKMGEFGKTVIKCPNCGTVYDEDLGHQHN